VVVRMVGSQITCRHTGPVPPGGPNYACVPRTRHHEVVSAAPC
jgi:hypothetical protein